ncbi:MAG: thioredoxin domain-containing protein [Syntrophobacteraceae bacterium]
MRESVRQKSLVGLSLAGVLFAVLAGLAEKYPWLHALCAGIGDGCKDTVVYSVLTVPLWIYGTAFYALLVASFMVKGWQSLVPWLVASLLGVEATLAHIMVTQKLLCLYCLGNLGVVVAIIALTFNRERLWQTLAVGLAVFVISFHLVSDGAKVLAENVGKGNESAVVAKVGDKEITASQLEGPLKAQIYEMEREIYRIKRQRLDEMIAEALLQKEAAARNVTAPELINQMVLSKGVSVTDDEVNQYYVDNRQRFAEWKGTLDDLKGRIRSTLQQQKQYQLVYEYARSLDSKYGVEDHLKVPVSPFANVNIEGSPMLGPPDASVTVIEFSDYECPSCRQAHEDVKKVREIYQGKLRWVFKDYPLKRHEYARKAAEAARCAAEQKKFWEYQDVLYGSKDPLTVDHMKGLAKGLGLNHDQFAQCLDTGKNAPAVEKELEEAQTVGVDRTPTFIINGRMATGSIGVDRFKQMIDEELAKQKRKP